METVYVSAGARDLADIYIYIYIYKDQRKNRITNYGLGVLHFEERHLESNFLRSWEACSLRCHKLLRYGLICVISSCRISANKGLVNLDPVTLPANRWVVGPGVQVKVFGCNANVDTGVCLLAIS